MCFSGKKGSDQGTLRRRAKLRGAIEAAPQPATSRTHEALALEDLNDDILTYILGFVDPATLVSLSRTSWAMHDAALGTYLWLQLCLKVREGGWWIWLVLRSFDP
jgi:hypothetical protein